MHSKPDRQALFEIADSQQGYFTAKQAIQCGYSSKNHHHYVRVDDWTREGRGIYRLAAYPTTERPDLMHWFLWSRNREDRPLGVYSHSTALSLYELSDVMPARIHMTVPRGFRRSAQIPRVLRLRHRDLPPKDVAHVMGFKVTTPLRTLIDVIEEGVLSRDLIQQAVSQALSRGLVTSRRAFREHPHVKAHPELQKKLEEYID